MLYFFIPSHMDKDVVLKYYVGKLWRILRKADVKKESKPGFNFHKSGLYFPSFLAYNKIM